MLRAAFAALIPFSVSFQKVLAMSSDPTPTKSSANPHSPPAGKARNPVERVFVWGLIAALLAVSGWEAFARFGYTNSLNSLQAAMAGDEDGQTLMLDQVPTHLSGSPVRELNEANRVVTYHWSGLLKDYGSIHIPYSSDNEVLGLLTADAPEEEPAAFASSDDAGAFDELQDAAPDEMSDNAGPGGGDEGGGGRRGFDPMQFDSDGDGKLSLEEAPDRMKERFAGIDSNGDGFVDPDEWDARPRARQSEGSDGPDRPLRPVDDTAADPSGDEGAAPADTPQEASSQDQPETTSNDAASDSTVEQPESTTEESAQPTTEQ
jgi:hypothetical protein